MTQKIAPQAQVRIRDDMNAAVEMINRLEVMRRQIEDRLATALLAGRVVDGDAVRVDLAAAGDELAITR